MGFELPVHEFGWESLPPAWEFQDDDPGFWDRTLAEVHAELDAKWGP